MSKEISYARALINAIQVEDNSAAQDSALNAILREKVNNALEVRKVALGASLFSESYESKKFVANKKAGLYEPPAKYDGSGIKAGKTYLAKDGSVHVVKIDNGIVVYEPKSKPGTMRSVLLRKPIEDFEDMLNEGSDPVYIVYPGESYKLKNGVLAEVITVIDNIVVYKALNDGGNDETSPPMRMPLGAFVDSKIVAE